MDAVRKVEEDKGKMQKAVPRLPFSKHLQSIPITDWYSKSGRFHVDRALVFPDKVDRKTGIPLFYLTANCYTRVEVSVVNTDIVINRLSLPR